MTTDIPLFALLNSETDYMLSGDGTIRITGFSIDSRGTLPGDLFFALPGRKTDGHHYIKEALDRGAAAVVHASPFREQLGTIPCVRVPRPRETLSRMSSRFYGFPSQRIFLIGVTGTNGKTTTSYLIFQILRSLGVSAGLISGYYCGTHSQLSAGMNQLSTPESFERHRQIRSFADSGCTHAVAELTSHALSAETARAQDLHLSRCVFTAMGRDHLDYHRDLETYYQCKLSMCRLSPSGRIVMDRDNPLLPMIEDPRRLSVLRRDICIISDERSSLVLKSADKTLQIIHDLEASFLRENVMLAAAAVWDLIPPGLKQLDLREIPPVPGRGERFSLGSDRHITVDYAHNPLGFSAVLSRPVQGRTIAIFGAAGERDRGKRQEMAAAADTLCDMIILTDEDPFDEDPLAILRDLRSGITQKQPGKTLFIIPSRPAAFSFACSLMNPGDELFLLGKGHETALRSQGREIPWSDLKAASSLANPTHRV